MRTIGIIAPCILLGAWSAPGDPSGTQPPVAAKEIAFDSHPAVAGEVPRLEGASGILRYANGCLYLQEGAIKTGLVMPNAYRFDGSTLASPKRAMRIGERVSVSGGFVSGETSRFECSRETPHVLMVDYTGPPSG